MLAAGGIEDFAPPIPSQILALLASTVNIPPSTASLSISAASVVLTAKLPLPSEGEATLAASRISSSLTTASEATAFFASLGNGTIRIISPPDVSVVREELVYQPPPPSPGGQGGLSTGALIAAIVAPTLVFLLICYLCIYKYQSAPKNYPITSKDPADDEEESVALLFDANLMLLDTILLDATTLFATKHLPLRDIPIVGSWDLRDARGSDYSLTSELRKRDSASATLQALCAKLRLSLNIASPICVSILHALLCEKENAGISHDVS
ncbi:MAG: hypothetical protein SGPRY_013122 [Prymnesium sp.]